MLLVVLQAEILIFLVNMAVVAEIALMLFSQLVLVVQIHNMGQVGEEALLVALEQLEQDMVVVVGVDIETHLQIVMEGQALVD
jgi:hypothetical protein